MTERYLRFFSVLGVLGALWGNVYAYYFALDFYVWSEFGVLAGPATPAIAGTYSLWVGMLLLAYILKIVFGKAFDRVFDVLWWTVPILSILILAQNIPAFISPSPSFNLDENLRFAMVVASSGVLLVALGRIEFQPQGPFFAGKPWWYRSVSALIIIIAAAAFYSTAAVIGFFRTQPLDQVSVESPVVHCLQGGRRSNFEVAFETENLRGLRCGGWASLVQKEGSFPGWFFVNDRSGELVMIDTANTQVSFEINSAGQMTITIDPIENWSLGDRYEP